MIHGLATWLNAADPAKVNATVLGKSALVVATDLDQFRRLLSTADAIVGFRVILRYRDKRPIVITSRNWKSKN